MFLHCNLNTVPRYFYRMIADFAKKKSKADNLIDLVYIKSRPELYLSPLHGHF